MSLRTSLGYEKDPNFERLLVKDVKKAAFKAAGDMGNVFAREGKAAGDKTAAEVVKGFRAEFTARQASLKEMVAKGLLDRAGMRRELRKLKSDFNKGITAAQDELRKQGRLTRAENTKLASSYKTVGTAAAGAGRKVGGLGRAMKSAGKAIAGLAAGFLGVTGLSRAFRFLLTDASKFETAMAQVATISKATGDELADLTDRVRDLSTRLPKSAEDLGYGYYQVLSAGITDTNEAFQVLESSARLASAGLLDTRDSVKVVTAVLNAYNLGADRAADVTDILFTTVEKGVTTVPELAAAMGNVIGTASQLGVSFDQVGAAVAALTKVLPNTEVATTSLNNLFFSVIKTGSEAQSTAKRLGIEWNLAGLQGMGFAGWIEHVTEKADGNIDTLVKLTGSMRAARAVLVLAGESAENFVDALDGMEDRAGATDRALAKTNGTLAAQATMLKNKVSAAWSEFALSITKAGVAMGNLVFPSDEQLAKLAEMGSTAPAVERFRQRRRAALGGGRPGGFPSPDSVSEARTRQAQRAAVAEAAAAESAAAAAATTADRVKYLKAAADLLEEEFGTSQDLLAVIRGLSEEAAGRSIVGSAGLFTPEEIDGMRETVELAREQLEIRKKNLAKLKESDAAIAKIREGAEEVGIAWGDVLDGVAGVAKGLLSVLDATGKLPDELRQVLRGVIDIAEAWRQVNALRAAGSLSFTSALGPVAAAVGALIGIAGAMSGGDAGRARREQIEAMRKLKESLDELSATIRSDINPAAQSADIAVVRRYLDQVTTTDPERGTRYGAFDVEGAPAELVDALKRLAGDTWEQIAEDGKVTGEEIKALLDAVGTAAFGVFGDDLQGQIEALEYLFGTLGDTAGDASARMEQFLAVLGQFSSSAADQLRAAFEESPEKARALLEQWARVLSGGGDPLAGLLGALGVTASELQQLISSGLSISGGGGASATRTVQVARSITEIQADAWQVYLEDIALSAREIRDLLTVMAGGSGGSVAAVVASARSNGTGAGTGAGGLSVDMSGWDIGLQGAPVSEEWFRDWLWPRLGEEVERRGIVRQLVQSGR